MQIGINLSPLKRYAVQHPFNNFMEMSGGWTAGYHRAGTPAPVFDIDADGNLISLEGGRVDRLVVPKDIDGKWHCQFDGEAEIRFLGGGIHESSQDGNHVTFIATGERMGRMQVLSINPENPPRNIKVFPDDKPETGWNDEFLDFLRPIPGPIRMMNWQQTNNSEVSEVADLRPNTYITQADLKSLKDGTATERMIDLCNILQKDIWFCIPHMATDDLVRNLAELVAEKLNPELKVYLELSNEVWNWSFRQTHYADEQGKLLELGDNRSTQHKFRWYAHRSVEIFNIWKPIFGDRLIRVLASQSAGPVRSEQIVEWNDAHKHADALAIAPYIGGHAKIAAETVEEVLESLRVSGPARGIPDIVATTVMHKITADKYGLRLIAYEGGQHLTSRSDPVLNEIYHQANLHLEMEKIYKEYFAACAAAGIDMMCHYSSIIEGSKYGHWGLIEEMGTTSPKLEAVLKYIEIEDHIRPARVAISVAKVGISGMEKFINEMHQALLNS